jgi:hypothetical protein
VAQATGLSASAPGEDWAEGLLRLEVRGSEARCSFCGKDRRQGVLLVAGGLAAMPDGKFGQGARICDECLDLCLEILAETSPS